MEIKIIPIGMVKSSFKKGDRNYKKLISNLIISKQFTEALHGLREFSHIYVLYWMHKISRQQQLTMKVHPWGKEEMPLLGFFATRTPSRPNPIGLSLVELLEVSRNRLTVRGLDALGGTPIIDIKPYDLWDIEEYDKIRIPEWWKKARPEKWAKWQQFENCYKQATT